jgi:hypothetical protein
MPIVLRVKGYRFGFYASDADGPPHVQVRKNGKHAKFWLSPKVELEFNRRFRPHEINEIAKLIVSRRTELLENWNGFFG